MKKYQIFYKNVFIGFLEINEDGKHKFIKCDGIEKVKEEIKEFFELFEESSEWREPIPLFKNRLEDAKRFGVERNIVNQTDPFQLVQVDN